LWIIGAVFGSLAACFIVVGIFLVVRYENGQ